MRLKVDAPPHHRLVVDGRTYEGGQTITVTDERAVELIADPHVPILKDTPAITGTRAELDQLAEKAGFDPTDFRTKQDVIDALTTQPEATGVGHPNPDQED